jgi:sirohydrochlorin cobaltochelatase
MIVAGDHALNDMAGDEPDSWISTFKAAGFEALTQLEGLGSNNSWADIYVEHLKALAPTVQAQQARDEAKK